MSAYEALFLIASLAVVILSVMAANHRGALWVVAIMADAVFSDYYISLGLPLGDGFMAACDLLVCGALYYLAAHRWELWLWITMLASAAGSLIHLLITIPLPNIVDQEDYLSVLEALNYIAILTVGSIAGRVLTRGKTGGSFGPWPRIRALVHPVLSKSQSTE